MSSKKLPLPESVLPTDSVQLGSKKSIAAPRLFRDLSPNSSQSIFSIESFKREARPIDKNLFHSRPPVERMDKYLPNVTHNESFSRSFNRIDVNLPSADVVVDVSDPVALFRPSLAQSKPSARGYDSDHSYYAEDENDDLTNNNNVKEEALSIHLQHTEDDESDETNCKYRQKIGDTSTSTSLTMMTSSGPQTNEVLTLVDDAASATDADHMTDDAEVEMNSMFNECPDNRMLDFDTDFGGQRTGEAMAFTDDDECRSKSSSSMHDHTTDGGASEFLYDSDATSFRNSDLFETSRPRSGNNNNLLITDLDHFNEQLSKMIKNHDYLFDNLKSGNHAGVDNIAGLPSFDSNMNLPVKSNTLASFSLSGNAKNEATNDTNNNKNSELEF